MPIEPHDATRSAKREIARSAIGRVLINRDCSAIAGCRKTTGSATTGLRRVYWSKEASSPSCAPYIGRSFWTCRPHTRQYIDPEDPQRGPVLIQRVPSLETGPNRKTMRNRFGQPPSGGGAVGVCTGPVLKKDKGRRKCFLSFLSRDKYPFQTVKKMYIVFAAIT
jgi:hypothetical protein